MYIVATQRTAEDRSIAKLVHDLFRCQIFYRGADTFFLSCSRTQLLTCTLGHPFCPSATCLHSSHRSFTSLFQTWSIGHDPEPAWASAISLSYLDFYPYLGPITRIGRQRIEVKIWKLSCEKKDVLIFLFPTFAKRAKKPANLAPLSLDPNSKWSGYLSVIRGGLDHPTTPFESLLSNLNENRTKISLAFSKHKWTRIWKLYRSKLISQCLSSLAIFLLSMAPLIRCL